MSENWKRALILPLHKKGDIAECSNFNYRGIAFLDVTYKVVASLLKKRMNNKRAKKLHDKYKCGIQKGRSTTDQISMLKQILIQRYKYDLPTQRPDYLLILKPHLTQFR